MIHDTNFTEIVQRRGRKLQVGVDGLKNRSCAVTGREHVQNTLGERVVAHRRAVCQRDEQDSPSIGGCKRSRDFDDLNRRGASSDCNGNGDSQGGGRG